MPSGIKLSLEVIDRIHNLYKDGKSTRQISHITGVCYSTVTRKVDPRLEESARRSREKRRTKYPTHARDHARRYRVRVGGRLIKVKKRPRPELCELCKEDKTYLAWHHWDDNHPELGMWLCGRCHQFGEGVEHGLKVEDYMLLKIMAEKAIQ